VKATAIDVTASTALVELRPCWLARWLGAQVVTVELELTLPVYSSDSPWRTVANHRTLSWLSSADRRMLHALEHRPRAGVPPAIARRP
jgi:hypothetical protein